MFEVGEHVELFDLIEARDTLVLRFATNLVAFEHSDVKVRAEDDSLEMLKRHSDRACS